MSTMTNRIETARNRMTLNLNRQDVIAEPFPHIIKDGFIEPDLYARLRAEFPSDDVFSRNSTLGGRAGRDLYRGDTAYEEFLKGSPAWREFYEYINSPAYLELALELFGENFEPFACKVSPRAARFVDYVEPREALADRSRLGRAVEDVAHLLAGSKHKDELFVRLDLAQGAVGYGKPVHCDRPNRLTSMVVYFCDGQEIEMEGGELLIHEHVEKKPYADYERHPKPELTKIISRIETKHNRGVFFLCSNNSYHSATPVRAQKEYRNFIYISVSSRAPSIW